VAGDVYDWTSSIGGFSSAAASPNIIADTTTMYYLKVTNTVGCSGRDTVEVFVNPAPVAAVGKSRAICAGASTVIGGPPVVGDQYIWTSNPAGFKFSKSLDTVAPASKITYYLEEDGTNGCSGFDSVTITVNPLPDAHWKDSFICDTIIFNPRTINNKTYTWTFGDGDSDLISINPQHVYRKKDLFKAELTTTDSNGCASSYDSTVNINCLVTHFDFAFYPNPFHGSATLKYSLYDSSKISIILYDALGKQISVIRNENESDGQYVIDINADKFNLAKGVYFLVFRSNEKNINIKIVNL